MRITPYHGLLMFFLLMFDPPTGIYFTLSDTLSQSVEVYIGQSVGVVPSSSIYHLLRAMCSLEKNGGVLSRGWKN